MFDEQQVSQVLAKCLNAKLLAAIACCSKSCQLAYKASVQHAHSKELWQKAKTVLHLPPARWVQHVLGPELSTPHALAVTRCLTPPFTILELLLRILKLGRQPLLRELCMWCRRNGYQPGFTMFIKDLLAKSGPLLEKDRSLLTLLLQDNVPYQVEFGTEQYTYTHELRMTTADYQLFQNVPLYLLQLFMVEAHVSI